MPCLVMVALAWSATFSTAQDASAARSRVGAAAIYGADKVIGGVGSAMGTANASTAALVPRWAASATVAQALQSKPAEEKPAAMSLVGIGKVSPPVVASRAEDAAKPSPDLAVSVVACC